MSFLPSRQQDRAQAQEQWRAWIRREHHNAAVLRSQWSKSVKYYGYWKDPHATRKLRADNEAGIRSKGYVTLASSTNANSYDSVLDWLEDNDSKN